MSNALSAALRRSWITSGLVIVACIAGLQHRTATRAQAGSSVSDARGGESAKGPVLVEDLQPVLFSGIPPDLTPDGRWLAYGVADRASEAERLVYVRNMGNGLTRCLTDRTSKDGWAIAPRWSPGGRWLAFVTRRNGQPRMAIWERERDRVDVVLDAPLAEPVKGGSWSETGSVLFVVAESPRPLKSAAADDKQAPRSPQVNVWRSAAARQVDARQDRNTTAQATGSHVPANGFSTVEKSPEQRPTQDVWAVSAESGRWATARWVMRGRALDEIAPSPDGRWLAVLGNLRMQSKGGTDSAPVVDLYLIPLGDPYAERAPDEPEKSVWTTARGQTVSPVVSGIPQDFSRSKGLSWAPDSHAVAYVSGGTFGTGDLFVVPFPSSTGTTSPRNVTTALSLDLSPDFTETDDKERYKRFAYGNREPGGAPLWTADSHAIIRAAGGDVWYIPVNGNGVPRNLTAQDLRHHFTNALAFVKPGGMRQVAGDDRWLLVHAVETATLREGVWRLRLSDGHLTPLIEAEQALTIGSGYGDVAESTGRIVTAVSAFNVPQELWTTSGATPADMQRLTSLNDQGAAWLKKLRRRDLQWTTPYRNVARGVLILPDASSITGRPPVVVHGYPGSAWASKLLHAFGIMEVAEPFALLSRGYAVFVMDIPFLDRGAYGPHGPMKAVVDAVEAGVATLVATGLVDERRVAVHSFSYGGQMVNSLLTGSTRFAAGIAGAGVSNLVSAAGTSVHGMSNYENAQGRMGATLWAEPQRYVANSPIFFLDRVTAPLLLYHGERDSVVPIGQAEEMYRGLERLSQDVTLLRYRELGHDFNASYVKRDLWSRIVDWLDARLPTPSSR